MSEKIGIIIVDGVGVNPPLKNTFANPIFGSPITIRCTYVEIPEIKGIIANRVPKNKGERKRNKADRWK